MGISYEVSPHQVIHGPDDSWDAEDRKDSAMFGELGGEVGNIGVMVAAVGEEPFNPVSMADDVLEKSCPTGIGREQ